MNIENISNINDCINNKIKDINCGGCGVFAFYFFIFNLIKNREVLNIYQLGDKDIPYKHFILGKNNICFDGTTICYKENVNGYTIFKKISILKLLSLLLFTTWNEKYDRKQNKEVIKIIYNNI